MIFRTRRSTVLARFSGRERHLPMESRVRVGATSALSSFTPGALGAMAAGLAVLAVGTMWIVFRK